MSGLLLILIVGLVLMICVRAWKLLNALCDVLDECEALRGKLIRLIDTMNNEK